jgi:hypothetical protein
MTRKKVSLSAGSATPVTDPTNFFSDQWEELRDSGIRPLNQSDLDSSPDLRAEFHRGAELLRITGDRAKPNYKLVPQMLRVADQLNAGNAFNGLLMPRRSSKTTDLFALALGRISSREDYQCSYTMTTTATKARQTLRDRSLATSWRS